MYHWGKGVMVTENGAALKLKIFKLFMMSDSRDHSLAWSIHYYITWKHPIDTQCPTNNITLQWNVKNAGYSFREATFPYFPFFLVTHRLHVYGKGFK